MRITIEHEGRVVQFNFQDGAVAEVNMHRNEDGSTQTTDFTFTIKGVHLWSKVDCLAEWALDLREEEA